MSNKAYHSSAIVASVICMFCGKSLGYIKEISSWYNGCHASCLKAYNVKRNAK